MTNPPATPSAPARQLRPTIKALPEHGRAHNRSMLLQYLFHEGPTSRAELARATGLTRVTVSDLVGSLIGEGLIEELVPQSEGRVGKPATGLRLRTDGFRIIAMDLTDEAVVRGAVLDMAGQMQARTTTAVEGLRGEAAFEAVVAMAAELLGRADRPVLGVGVASPGVVNDEGVILQAPNRDWYGVPLAARLQDKLGVPAHIANDANAAVLGEFTYGAASAAGVMVVTVGEGVGAGTVLHGVLVQGRGHAAGELGHVTVVDDQDGACVDPLGRPALCACGRYGCLETVLSVPALRRRVDGVTADEAGQALRAVGGRLGTALAPVVSALNLAEVILAGPTGLLGGVLLDEARDTILARTMPVIGAALEVRMTRLGDDSALMGAAVLVLSGQLGFS
jgi:predicted NBD/HSP70 family sugar kinase